MQTPTEAENALRDYINSRQLEDGAVLPAVEALANELSVQEEELLAAIRSAERRGEIARDEEGRMFVHSPPVIADNDMFSFKSSAALEGTELYTAVISASVLPISAEERPDSVEQLARRSLSLASNDECALIYRIRSIEGEPRVIHRAFIDPKRFPPSFLHDHDFSTKSLVEIYQEYGYRITHRNTMLTAELPNQEELDIFRCSSQEPLLDAKQELFAQDPVSGQSFIIEFLHATYMRWSYRIENRTFRQRSRKPTKRTLTRQFIG